MKKAQEKAKREMTKFRCKGEGTRELNTKNQREKKFEKYGDSW